MIETPHPFPPAAWVRAAARTPRTPIVLALVLAMVTTGPYLAAIALTPPDRVFGGFFYLGDDANTYLAKMREGWDGSWIWTNRYSTEGGPGAYFFIFWIFLGRVAAISHLPLLVVYHLAMVAGAFTLMLAGWYLIQHFVEEKRAWRFALIFMAFGLGCGYLIWALKPTLHLASGADALDWRMPELSAFYSILALPHFVWAATFQALGIVLTLRSAQHGSLRLGLLAGLAWTGEALIHAQMPILLGAAMAVALAYRRPPATRGWVGAGLAFVLPAPYVIYSYEASLHSVEVMRWSAQWRNNLPPDLLSFALALAPQLVLAVLALPSMLRRRSREDVFLLAWLLLLAAILWLPNPAGNLRRRFFDGIYLALVVMAARGLYLVLLPRLRSERARRLVPFSWVAGASIGSIFLVVAPPLLMTSNHSAYSMPAGVDGGLRWLDAQPPGIVLSTEDVGLVVPAYTSDTVYVGQYSETFNWSAKAVRARGVLSGQEDLASFEADQHIRVRYVFWTEQVPGPKDRPVPLEGTPRGVGPPAYVVPGVRVYRLY